MTRHPMPDHYKIHLLEHGQPGDWRTLQGRRVMVVPSPNGPSLSQPLDAGDDLHYPYVLDVALALQVARVGDQWYTSNMERVVVAGFSCLTCQFTWLDRVSPTFVVGRNGQLPLGAGHLLRPVVPRGPHGEAAATAPTCTHGHAPVDTGLAWSYCRRCDATMRFVNLNWEVQLDSGRSNPNLSDSVPSDR